MPKNVNAVLTFIFKWWHQFIYIKRKKASQSWKGKVILNCFIMDFHNINPMLRSGISKLFKSTSRYFSVARVLLLSMSTFPVVPPFIGNCSLPPLLKGKKESLAGSGGFHCLPPAAPEPVKACWLSAQSPISIARPWGRLRCRGTWGKDAQCFCCSSQELCLPGGQTHWSNKFRARVHPAWDKDSTDCHVQWAVYSQSSSTTLISPDCHHKRAALLKIITCTTPRKRPLENRIM